MILEIIGLSGAFNAITAGDEVAASKPDPGIFLETAHRLGVRPQDCVVLEDSPHGVSASRAAGMVSVAIPNRFSAYQDFGLADVVLRDLFVFVQYLESITK